MKAEGARRSPASRSSSEVLPEPEGPNSATTLWVTSASTSSAKVGQREPDPPQHELHSDRVLWRSSHSLPQTARKAMATETARSRKASPSWPSWTS